MRRSLSLSGSCWFCWRSDAAVAAPCCFPLFAAPARPLGLGALVATKTLLFISFRHSRSCRSSVWHRFSRAPPRRPLQLISEASEHWLILYVSFLPLTLYGGCSITRGTVWNHFCSRRVRPVLRSIILARNVVSAPKKQCQQTLFFLYDARLPCASETSARGLCVFCSYGSVPCPRFRPAKHVAPELTSYRLFLLRPRSLSVNRPQFSLLLPGLWRLLCTQ